MIDSSIIDEVLESLDKRSFEGYASIDFQHHRKFRLSTHPLRWMEEAGSR